MGNPQGMYELYKKQGLGLRMGFGKKAAVLVIDMQNDFLDPNAISTLYPSSVEMIPYIRRLLNLAKSKGVTVFYTRGTVNPNGVGESLWRYKMRSHREGKTQIEGTRGWEITAELAPQQNDIVINKRRPSAFFHTDLDVFLRDLGVDTLIICGMSVSGCVRASVLDAFMRDYRCMIPRECVADRHPAIYEANMFDMDSKYADVITLEEACMYLESLPPR
jgi:maleamate amidohydrolase